MLISLFCGCTVVRLQNKLLADCGTFGRHIILMFVENFLLCLQLFCQLESISKDFKTYHLVPNLLLVSKSSPFNSYLASSGRNGYFSSLQDSEHLRPGVLIKQCPEPGCSLAGVITALIESQEVWDARRAVRNDLEKQSECSAFTFKKKKICNI